MERQRWDLGGVMEVYTKGNGPRFNLMSRLWLNRMREVEDGDRALYRVLYTNTWFKVRNPHPTYILMLGASPFRISCQDYVHLATKYYQKLSIITAARKWGAGFNLFLAEKKVTLNILFWHDVYSSIIVTFGKEMSFIVLFCFGWKQNCKHWK